MSDWLRDLVLSKGPFLSREDFVKKYMPEYATEYRPDYRIRTYVDGSGRVRVP